MEEVCAHVEVEQFATVGHYCNGQEQRMHELLVHTLLNRGMVSRVAGLRCRASSATRERLQAMQQQQQQQRQQRREGRRRAASRARQHPSTKCLGTNHNQNSVYDEGLDDEVPPRKNTKKP